VQPSDFLASSQLLGFTKFLFYLEHQIIEGHPSTISIKKHLIILSIKMIIEPFFQLKALSE